MTIYLYIFQGGNFSKKDGKHLHLISPSVFFCCSYLKTKSPWKVNESLFEKTCIPLPHCRLNACRVVEFPFPIGLFERDEAGCKSQVNLAR